VSILDLVEVARVLNVPETWVFTGYLCLGFRVGWQEDTQRGWDLV
jgi:hypothetical protein